MPTANEPLPPDRPLTAEELDAIEALEAQVTREVRPLRNDNATCESCMDEDRPAICTLAWEDAHSGESGEPYLCQECLDRDYQTVRLLALIRELIADLDGRDEEARERWIQKMLDETGIRSMDFRNGASMELEPAKELVARWVAAAKTLLAPDGVEAPNYTETVCEFTQAGEFERYAFIVQRVAHDKLTPHQARQKAEARLAEVEAERDVLRDGLAVERAAADEYRSRAEAAEAEIARWPSDWETRFPCDGMCRDYAEEDCSRHGRPPADIWQVVTKVQAQRDEAKAELARERQFCAASGHPRTAASQIIREHAEYRTGVAAALAFADEMAGYCSPRGVAQSYAQRLRETVETAMKGAHRG